MAGNNHSYENEFCSWLSERVTRAQLSTFYTELLYISDYCLSRHKISRPLFEVADIGSLQKIEKITEEWNHRKVAASAIKFYCTFIEETHPACASSGLLLNSQSEQDIDSTDSPLVEVIKAAGIRYVDKRGKGGCLWLIGGSELRPFVEKCKTLGVNFRYKFDGGQATSHQEAWWTAGEIRNSINDGKLYENGIAKKNVGVSVEHTVADNDSRSKPEQNKERIRQIRITFIDWMIKQGIKSGDTLIIISALKQCEKYISHADSFDNEIFLIDKPAELLKLRHIIKGNPQFNKNNKQKRQLETAIDLLFQFLVWKDGGQNNSKVGTNRDIVQTEVDKLLDDELFGPLRDELKKQQIITVEQLKAVKLWPFMNQYNLYSIATRQLVLEKVRSYLHPTGDIDSNKLFHLHCGGVIYLGETPAETFLQFCEAMTRKYPLRIRSLIGKHVSGNMEIAIRRDSYWANPLKMENPTAYIDPKMTPESVLCATRWICEMCGEASTNITLKAPINTESPIKDSIDTVKTRPMESETCVTNASNKIASVEKEKNDELTIESLEKIVLEADIEGITFAELKKRLGFGINATKDLIKKSLHVVEFKDKLVHEDAFVDWTEGADQLEAILDKLMQKNDGYTSAAQLYEYACVGMPLFLNDNDIEGERNVYDIAQHLFEKVKYHGREYLFSGKQHISTTSNDFGVIGSNFDICCKFAEDQGGVFKYVDLVEYLESIGVKTGNLRMQLHIYDEPYFLYYEEGVLMLSKSMHIDDCWKKQTSHALRKLFDDVGDHIVLREIQSFWFDQLPDLPGGRGWTPLLLQSVLKFYGEELGCRTIIAMEGQGIDTLHTMLVDKNSAIQDFGDVVITYLIENSMQQRIFGAEELRLKLVVANIIQGNELLNNVPKALGNDERFAWNADGTKVKIRV